LRDQGHEAFSAFSAFSTSASGILGDADDTFHRAFCFRARERNRESGLLGAGVANCEVFPHGKLGIPGPEPRTGIVVRSEVVSVEFARRGRFPTSQALQPVDPEAIAELWGRFEAVHVEIDAKDLLVEGELPRDLTSADLVERELSPGQRSSGMSGGGDHRPVLAGFTL
jgi:hypothetical protein